MKNFNKLQTLLLSFIFACNIITVRAQSLGDFRTHQTGDWNQTATWERYNGFGWITPAPNFPTNADQEITIQNLHVVLVTAAVTVDQVTIAPGGQITIDSADVLTINNGILAPDILVRGTLLNRKGTLSFIGGSTMTVNGGTYIHNTSSSASSVLAASTLSSNSTWIYRGSNTLTPAVSISGRTFGNLIFESESGSWSTTTSGGTASSCTNLTISNNVTVNNNYTGTFIVNGNYAVNGTLTNGTGTQTFSLTSTLKTISGTGLTNCFDVLNINAGASYTVLSSSLTVSTATTLVNMGSLLFSAGTLQVNSGGTFIHNTTSGSGLVLNATTLDANSTWIYRGSNVLQPSVAFDGRTYGHLQFESTVGSWSISPNATSPSSCTNFTVGSGVTINNGNTALFTVNGNFTINGAITNGAGIQSYLLTGTGTFISGLGLTTFFDQLTIQSGASYSLLNHLTTSNSAVLNVNGTLACDTNVVSGIAGNATFALTAGATLKTGNTGGINSTIFGFFIKNYDPGANYEFNGAFTQTTFFPNFIINDLTINTSFGAQVNNNELSLTIKGTLNLISGLFNVGANNINLDGNAIAGTGTNLITTSASSLQFHGSATGCYIPSTVTSLNNLFVHKPSNHVDVNSNITVSGNLNLVQGNLNCGPFVITSSGVISGGSATSYINGALVRRPTSGLIASLLFPIGKSGYQPFTFNSINFSGNNNRLQVEAFESTPTGSPDGVSLHYAMVDRSWKISIPSGNNNITSIASVSVTPATPTPALSATSLIGFSLTNGALSYASSGGSLASTTLTSTIALTPAQIADFNSGDGSFIGIGNSVLSAGIYCIGPSASYVPPSGPAYINGNSPYPSITAAVNELNDSTASGHVIYELQNDYTSVSEVSPINITYSGSPGATAVFRPRSDLIGTLLISKNASMADRGLINFNGGDYITFDGSPGGVMSSTIGLVVRNSTGGVSAPTFNMVNDATNIILNALQIEAGIADAVIRIDSTNGIVGNQFISILNCDIRDRSDVSNLRPDNGILNTGTGSGSTCNNDVIIYNNKIFNCTKEALYAFSPGISGNWVFNNNSVYSTYTDGNFGSFIQFSSTESGTSLAITNNYFGGTAPLATGGSYISESNTFYGFFVNIPNDGLATITNNTVRKLSFALGGNVSATLIFNTGRSDIINNTFGDAANPDDIVFSDSSNVTQFRGILCSSSQNLSSVSISGNYFNNITIKKSTGSANAIFISYTNASLMVAPAIINFNSINTINFPVGGTTSGLDISGGNGGTANTIVSGNSLKNINLTNVNGISFAGIRTSRCPVTISDNIIGDVNINHDISIAGSGINYGIVSTGSNGAISVLNNSISNITCSNSLTTTGQLFGISHNSGSGTFAHVVSNNIIQNLRSASQKSISETANVNNYTLFGIYYSSFGTGQLIKLNKISGLYLTTTAAVNPIVTGIGVASGNIKVSENSIYDLRNSATNTITYPVIAGIKTNSNGGNASFVNNMISLSNSIDSNGVSIYGIYDNNAFGSLPANDYSYNSIAISGYTTNNARSSAFWKNNSTSQTTLRNNILYNKRTGGTAKHYAIAHETGSSGNWNSSTSNFNNLFALDTSTVGFWGGADKSFATWKTTSLGDLNSKNSNVEFVDINTDLHLTSNGNCELNSSGTPISVTNDFDLTARDTIMPDIGAHEFISNSPLAEITFMIEGYYAGNNTLYPVLYNSGASLDSTICDTVFIELHYPTTPYSTFYSVTGILKTDGTVECVIPCSAQFNSYYIYIKMRNGVETVSKYPVNFTGFTNFNFAY
jgi:hypothetical protein